MLENMDLWKYNEGDVTHVGLGHTSPITRLRISPDERLIVTASEDGAIFIWQMPELEPKQAIVEEQTKEDDSSEVSIK
ncbi:unnamed protein product [Protopolystoma xenopodis]|uniref:Uncharacterized protein n=1 Tax=Protopolystoma xenopodis TaxID=117903 RepID=A0A448X0X2_9PLAT|nr:unnamed protein product [Protopolystoma xenopodis]